MSRKVIVRRNPKHEELSDACARGDMAKVRALVEEGLDLGEPWSTDRYPLVMALFRNDVAMLSYLLEHGMPPWLNLRKIVREDPEGDASDYGLLHGWKPDQHEARLCLLEHGSPVASGKTGYGALTTLVGLREKAWDSMMGEKSDAFFAAVLARQPNVDQPMDTRGTLLHQIALGNNRYVPPLVALSKNIDAREFVDEPSSTPLARAVIRGNDLAVEALLRCGANPNLLDHTGMKSILDRALFEQSCASSSSSSHFERIVDLLRGHGAKTREELALAGELGAAE